MKDKLQLIAYILIVLSGLTIPLAVSMNWGNEMLFACSFGGLLGLMMYILGSRAKSSF